jgi:hypothetical protein
MSRTGRPRAERSRTDEAPKLAMKQGLLCGIIDCSTHCSYTSFWEICTIRIDSSSMTELEVLSFNVIFSILAYLLIAEYSVQE